METDIWANALYREVAVGDTFFLSSSTRKLPGKIAEVTVTKVEDRVFYITHPGGVTMPVKFSKLNGLPVNISEWYQGTGLRVCPVRDWESFIEKVAHWSGQELMTPEDVESLVAGVKNKSTHDYEAAHGAEKDCWQKVLQAIADGADNPAALAEAALRTIEIPFGRYMA